MTEVVENQTPYNTPSRYSELPHTSTSEWRLVMPLREFATKPYTDPLEPPWTDPANPGTGWDERTPLATLTHAAQELQANQGVEFYYLPQVRALADLAVTGRLAYETLAGQKFRTPMDVVSALGLDADLEPAALEVVKRAQSVAWAIRGNPSWRATLRPRLGWIGVSGEDDVPHRPCNVESLSAPQYDVDVPVGERTYRTRIAVIEDSYLVPPSQMDGDPPTFLPPDEQPTISRESDYIFVYMAGDASRVEEAADLLAPLLNAAAARGKKVSVVAFDMIGWGYSSRRVRDAQGDALLFDQTMFPTEPYPVNPPALQFVEEFVVALIEMLAVKIRFFDLNKVVPIGGSLGGNLALRLGRRSDLLWLKAVCGWSPASVWPSNATNPNTGVIVGDGAAAGAVVGFVAGAAVGAAVGGPLGALIGGIVGGIIGAGTGAGVAGAAAPSLGEAAIKECSEQMNALEEPDQRAMHFAQVFDNDTVPLGLLPPQASMWYREGWACKPVTIVKDRLARREVYDDAFRRWHWRISQDQLVYSHRDPEPPGTPRAGTPRYLLNTVPMLLASGADDDYQVLNVPNPNIYLWTQELAKKMTVPGTTLFLNDTGHSIHNERPVRLAEAILAFLEEWNPPAPQSRVDLSYLVPLLLAD